MKQRIKKGLRILLGLVCAAFLCAACGADELSREADYSGTYTDKQGTQEVYSELTLSRSGDGTYAAELRIYRTISMTGTAEETGDGKLRFVCDRPDIQVAGDIVIDGEAAELTITESDTYLLDVGMVCRFPDGA